MSTHYTRPIQTGETTKLRDFARVCALRFGALFHMRDLPSDAEWTTPTVRDYEYERVHMANEELAKYKSMTLDEAETRRKAGIQKQLDDYQARLLEQAQAKVRYTAMLEKVVAWEVSDQLRELKAFMVHQLEESITHDCTPREPDPIPDETAEAWRAKRIQWAEEDVVRARNQRDEAEASVASNVAWITDLLTRLDAVEE